MRGNADGHRAVNPFWFRVVSQTGRSGLRPVAVSMRTAGMSRTSCWPLCVVGESASHIAKVSYTLSKTFPSHAQHSRQIGCAFVLPAAAGFVNFRHFHGKNARRVFKIAFCDVGLRDATVHVISKCIAWVNERYECFRLYNWPNLRCP